MDEGNRRGAQAPVRDPMRRNHAKQPRRSPSAWCEPRRQGDPRRGADPTWGPARARPKPLQRRHGGVRAGPSRWWVSRQRRARFPAIADRANRESGRAVLATWRLTGHVEQSSASQASLAPVVPRDRARARRRSSTRPKAVTMLERGLKDRADDVLLRSERPALAQGGHYPKACRTAKALELDVRRVENWRDKSSSVSRRSGALQSHLRARAGRARRGQRPRALEPEHAFLSRTARPTRTPSTTSRCVRSTWSDSRTRSRTSCPRSARCSKRSPPELERYA